MNKSQVFDLGEEAPDSVLRRLFLNLEKLKLSGDEFADKIEEKLRIIVSWTTFRWSEFIFFIFLSIPYCLFHLVNIWKFHTY